MWKISATAARWCISILRRSLTVVTLSCGPGRLEYDSTTTIESPSNDQEGTAEVYDSRVLVPRFCGGLRSGPRGGGGAAAGRGAGGGRAGGRGRGRPRN